MISRYMELHCLHKKRPAPQYIVAYMWDVQPVDVSLLLSVSSQ